MKGFARLAGLSILLLGAGPSSGQESGGGGVPGGVIGGPFEGVVSDSGSDYDHPPKAIKITRPQYPKDALEKRIEGTVVLEILIDVNGHVVRTRTLSPVAGLDEAAIDCVKQWEFKPAVKKGQPVAALARAPITFRAPAAPTKASPTPPPAQSGARSIPSGTTQRLGGLSFDPQGADFTAWLDHFRIEIYNNWLIPSAAELGYHGHVDFEFVVERDGSVSSTRMLSSSETPSFDRAARNALVGSKFLALPSDYGPPRVTMDVTFSYNEASPGTKPSPPPLPAGKPNEPAGEGQAPTVAPSPREEAVEGGRVSEDTPERQAELKAMGVVFNYDHPPQPIKITRPRYPEEALAPKLSATVVLEIVIDAEGHVAKALFVHSVPAFDAAAVECVKAWLFKPAMKGGHPVTTVARAPITFHWSEPANSASPSPNPAASRPDSN